MSYCAYTRKPSKVCDLSLAQNYPAEHFLYYEDFIKLKQILVGVFSDLNLF